MSAEFDTIARRIAGDAIPELVELARHIAEAEIDVIRVRRVRRDLVSRALNPCERTPVRAHDLRNKSPCLVALRRSLIRMKEESESAKQVLYFGPEFAITDRYERRALSRCRFAVRAFDAARASAIITKVAP